MKIAQLKDYVGTEISIQGWLYGRRDGKFVHFLLMRDGTGTIQAVVTDDVLKSSGVDYTQLFQESSLEIRGKVSEHPKQPGVYEIQVSGIKIIGMSSPDYPISPKEHGTDFLMEHRHLWLRSPRQTAIMKVRAQVEHAIMLFLDESGFTRVDAPILTPSSAEGTSTLFGLDYFGDQAFLSQTGQLYMEAAVAALGEVYCFGPTFRAEKSKTRRHLTEFWMVEPEIAFCSFEDLFTFEEDLIHFVLRMIWAKCSPELKILERDTSALWLIQKPFPRISYSEACKLLGITFGQDLGAEHETILSSSFDGQPVFVHSFPAACKAFYMQPFGEGLTLSLDCLAPEGFGEIIGGGMRIHDPLLLEKKIEEYGLSGLDWYQDLRRYGSVPHGGFGVGIERLVAWICGLPHIREAAPFARTMSRIYP
jgi:asparaginyl-tRNA synthetase